MGGVLWGPTGKVPLQPHQACVEGQASCEENHDTHVQSVEYKTWLGLNFF